MPQFEPVTYFFKEPVVGTVRSGDNYASWAIDKVQFAFLMGDKPQPPDWLVFKLHAELVGDTGDEIPVQVLSLLDLEGGMHEAFQREFNAAWDALDAAGD